MDANEKMIKDLVFHIEEFIENHPKECNDNYIEIVEKAKIIVQDAEKRDKVRDMDEVLDKKRREIAQDLFENSDLDGLTCVDSENFESSGDYYMIDFYAENEDNPKGNSIECSFVVEFKENSIIVLDSHVNSW